jgi:hypothetical protein
LLDQLISPLLFHGTEVPVASNAELSEFSRVDLNPRPPKVKTEHPPFVLVGLGPYAQHSYFGFFKKNNIQPSLIIDLEASRKKTNDFLEDVQMDIPCFFVETELRDSKQLPLHLKETLKSVLKKHGVTHAIIATEPKAHLAYVEFFIENNIRALVEKPLTAPTNLVTDIDASGKILEDYQYIKSLCQKNGINRDPIEIMCQRRYHPVYTFLMDYIGKFIEEFGVRLTYCDIYHCDGMWNMPPEYFTRENHPYKYGYGKLFHSGYHFMDLLAWLIQINSLDSPGVSDSGEFYAVPFTPQDLMQAMPSSKHEKLLQSPTSLPLHGNPKDLGELDFFGLMQLKKGDSTVFTSNINLLQTGFSRRSWGELPKDTYKSNGRVRHERINLQFGPLLNIQLHSYQSAERRDNSTIPLGEVGSKEHFDLYFFRNSGVIGGEPFAKVSLNDLVDLHKDFKGCNNLARERCFLSFLYDQPSQSTLEDHSLGITLLSSAYKALYHKRNGLSPTVNFSL